MILVSLILCVHPCSLGSLQIRMGLLGVLSEVHLAVIVELEIVPRDILIP